MSDHGFLSKLNLVLQQHLEDEQFGVSELAEEMGMSRSNLLRKVRNSARVSASQYIRQFRLEKAMELLSSKSKTVSEVAFEVGFSSTSYFIKCFREYYGYPPGETGKKSDHKDSASVGIHRLVAIMFTDIEGYTSLMQQDEKEAVRFRTKHREVFNTITKKYNGRILQYYGDGTLSTFSSAIDAVRCGIEMQLALREEPAIPVRIGIHSGDIIATNEDVIGDGVNVASRIESLATSGSVYISGKVYDEVKNQKDIHTVSKGVFELKNVDRPMEVFAISNYGLADYNAKPPESTTIGPTNIRTPEESYKRKRSFGYTWLLLIPFVIIIGYLIFFWTDLSRQTTTGNLSQTDGVEKSIAVIPFINDSNDSTNVYIINGLMESILNNLQKIEDIRVVSRTSVEIYRNSEKRIPEIAEELGVTYFVEGSGQKIGNEILLNIQLVDGASDTHLWAEQYQRQATGIFELQAEVAKRIADEIQVIITPEEEEQIDKVYTDNLEAWDSFTVGLELMYSQDVGNVEESINYFKEAIELDPEFARAYAGVAIAYFFLDERQEKKQYVELVNEYADKAMLYDPKLPQSLVAKALYYILTKRFDEAEPHLEKALKYEPNSSLILNILSDFYTSYKPNTRKYLQFALRSTQVDVATSDSVSASFSYLHLSNALAQSGLIKQALSSINRSLDLYPANMYSKYVKVYVEYASHLDIAKARQEMEAILKLDTTRLDVLQEVGKLCYFMDDYEAAYKYYGRYIASVEEQNFNIYPAENGKIAVVLDRVGEVEKSREYMDKFLTFIKRDNSIYNSLLWASYFSYKGETEKAIEKLNEFSKERDYFYWTLLFLDDDALLDNIRLHPDYPSIYQRIKENFWESHRETKAELKKKGLI